MADNFNEQELYEIFQKRLPPEPMPPDVQERLTAKVMDAVALLRAEQLEKESDTQLRSVETPIHKGQLGNEANRRRNRGRQTGFWSGALAQIGKRLSLAPSLAFATATAAVVLFALFYGPTFFSRIFVELPDRPSTGSAGIATLPSGLGDPTVDAQQPVEVASNDFPPTDTPDSTEPTRAEPAPDTPAIPAVNVEGSGGGEPIEGGVTPREPVDENGEATPLLVPTATPAPLGAGRPAADIEAGEPPSQYTRVAAVSATPSKTVTAAPTATRAPGQLTTTQNGNGSTAPTSTATVSRTPSRTPVATSQQSGQQSGVGNGVLLPTPTNTPSAFSGGTRRATPTRTPTLTPSRTPSRTPTRPPTATPTKTSVAVVVASSPTPTRTPTPTMMPGQLTVGTPRTLTPTPTNTPLPTNTPTNTPLPTATSTNPPSPTPTSTNTPWPTFTPTATPTNTPWPTLTPTDTPTNTPLPTFTPTDTPTNTPWPTLTPTDTPTNTPTNTPLPTFTPTDTPTNTPTNTPLPTDTPTATATPVNVAPVAVDDRFGTREDEPLNLSIDQLLANDYDPNGTRPSFERIVAEGMRGGAVSYDPDSRMIRFTPTPNLNGEDAGAFQYQITDGEFSARAWVYITIEPVNDPPTFISQAPQSVTQGVQYVYNIVTHDPDVNDTRTIAAIRTLPDWLTLVDYGNGTGQLYGIPGEAHVGNHEVELEVRDAAGASTRQTFTITVTPAPPPPSPSPSPEQEPEATHGVRPAGSTNALAGQPFSLDVEIGSGYSAELDSSPSWLRLEPAADGVVRLVGEPTVNDVGEYAVNLVIKDGAGGSETWSIPVRVMPAD